MFKKLWRYLVAPNIDSQNTGHYVYQRQNGLVVNGIRGNAAINVGSMRATSYGTMVVGPALVRADPTVTGNPNVGLVLQPLTEDTNSISNL